MHRAPEDMVGFIRLDGEEVAPFWCDIDMEIEVNKYAPYDIFQMKDEILQSANDSQERWSKMNEEEQFFYERLMREALEVLHENVPMWMPQSLVEGDGNHVGIKFNIVNTEINRFIEGVKFKSELRNEKIKAGLVDVLERVSEDDDVEGDGS